MKLKDIYIYPIKSLGGIRMDRAKVEVKGFQYDRRWMLVDEEGVFITQRKFPKMALMKCGLTGEGIKVWNSQSPEDFIIIPFEATTGHKREVVIWEDQVMAEYVSPEVDEWMSRKLDMDCRLVKMQEDADRTLKPKYTVNGETVSFADSMPYMVIGQSSLDDLNSRLEEKIKMDRFRPNLVFEGGQPFEEDGWNIVQIGKCRFKVTKPCARCVLITVDQQTAVKGKEPLRTLSQYRTVENKVMFGQNMLALNLGEINVGDEVVCL
jgi:uncharacterized protein